MHDRFCTGTPEYLVQCWYVFCHFGRGGPASSVVGSPIVDCVVEEPSRCKWHYAGECDGLTAVASGSMTRRGGGSRKRTTPWWMLRLSLQAKDIWQLLHVPLFTTHLRFQLLPAEFPGHVVTRLGCDSVVKALLGKRKSRRYDSVHVHWYILYSGIFFCVVTSRNWVSIQSRFDKYYLVNSVRTIRKIFVKCFCHVSFGLHDSFLCEVLSHPSYTWLSVCKEYEIACIYLQPRFALQNAL